MIKPKAIIVDIDGTLADCSHRVHHLQRTPKDWDAFYRGIHEDLTHEHVLMLVEFFDRSHIQVIYVTGRSEAWRNDTEAWLSHRGLSGYTHLHMRPDGDHRADDVLKREIYERDIQPYYDVLFALEDRSRVVKMWRSIGVPCLQVAEGDF